MQRHHATHPVVAIVHATRHNTVPLTFVKRLLDARVVFFLTKMNFLSNIAAVDTPQDLFDGEVHGTSKAASFVHQLLSVQQWRCRFKFTGVVSWDCFDQHGRTFHCTSWPIGFLFVVDIACNAFRKALYARSTPSVLPIAFSLPPSTAPLP